MLSASGWQSLVQPYMVRLGAAEYAAQKRAAKGKKFRFSPSEYMRSLILCMDRDDEEGFKSLKLEQGYSSAVQS